MRLIYTTPFRYLFTLILLFFFLKCNCQIRTELLGDNIESLEAAIGRKEMVQLVIDKLEIVKQRAISANNDIMLARSLYDLMRIRDLRTEDTLYFRNSAFMDTVINSRYASPRLKAIIHILHAQRINNFDHRSKKFNAAAYYTKDLSIDYAALTTRQRDSIWANDLDAAFNAHPFKGSIDNMLWLSSNPDVFLFKPEFEDLILSEKINLAARSSQYRFENDANLPGWASLPSKDFVNKLDSIAKNDKEVNVLSGYQRWEAHHNFSGPIAAFIESLARKYCFAASQGDSVFNNAYISYLQSSIRSPYALLRAHAVYQLCLLWNEQGNAYVDYANEYSYQTTIHKQNEFLPAKALSLYETNNGLIKQYPSFSKILDIMAGQILRPGIRVELENKQIPGLPIGIRTVYKNVAFLYYRVVKVNGEQLENKGFPSIQAMFGNKTLVQDRFKLPLPADHNKHAVYLKLDPLPEGAYQVLFSSREIVKGDSSVFAVPLQVTRIAAVNSDNRVYVLDRKTGFPLTGATVTAFYKSSPAGKVNIRKVNTAGYVTMPDSLIDTLNIIYHNDTLKYHYKLQDHNNDEDIYDKDEFDGLADYYNQKIKMHIFTDRAIYRPGQTVRFKIIFLTSDAKTGEPIIFNKENLGNATLNNIFKKWFKAHENVIKLKDPFGRVIDSAAINVNDFGSFAGLFTLPKSAATGSWEISGNPDADNRNNGSFEVEEYKRPTIELSMVKQNKTLNPGEPFKIQLKLRSFSGANLANIPVKYAIVRNGAVPLKNGHKKGSDKDYKEAKIANTTGFTDVAGLLSIAVSDTSLAKLKLNDSLQWDYNYSINADATDATGESTDISGGVQTSSRPVRIAIPLDMIYDRQQLPSLNVRTATDYEGTISRIVTLKLYKTSDPDLEGRCLMPVDQWIYMQADWNKWFPGMAITTGVKEYRKLVLDTLVNTALFQNLRLPKNKIAAGYYELEAVTKEGDRTTGKFNRKFRVFDSAAKNIVRDDIDYLSSNTARPGDTIVWYNSADTAGYSIYQVMYKAGKDKAVKNIYQEVRSVQGINKWAYHLPLNMTGNLELTHVYITNNNIITKKRTVYIQEPATFQPEIIVEKYRKVMQPGARDTIIISVKTKNENTAAELMTTLYDASLDKLEKHDWGLPDQNKYFRGPRSEWTYSLSDPVKLGDNGLNDNLIKLSDIFPGRTIGSLLNGQAAGVSIINASGLNEVVVAGYGSIYKRNLLGSVSTVMVRGISSIGDYKQPLIILDGQVFSGDLKNLNPGSITQAVVLKGADAAAIYGIAGSTGVLIISTKGPIVLPAAPEPVIKIRKDFNETAFFFPQLHAGTDGYYTFSFTMPETATEWNWKILAHTKKAQFMYLEKKLQTQLDLMVQPNVPRLLYQGDQIRLQTRISNLSAEAISGQLTCKIEDAVTGRDITTALIHDGTKSFRLSMKSSGSEAFRFRVPEGQISPLKIVISARSGNSADAEEHIIPVLSPDVFVRQSQLFSFSKQATLTLPALKLPAGAVLYGVGLSVNQKPQAALINALPWLANYSYDCAEQTFNKLRAEATAVQLMQRDTFAQRSYQKAIATVNTPQKEQAIPEDLAEESMPWLYLNNETTNQQKQLFGLLDTARTKAKIAERLGKLVKLQQPDGGLAWFEGGKSNEYISAYVLAGFGQLRQDMQLYKSIAGPYQEKLVSNLVTYNVSQLLKTTVDNNDLFILYALSYWNSKTTATPAVSIKVKQLLDIAWKNIDHKDLEQQALLIVSTLRFRTTKDTLYNKALQQLENIRQSAIEDQANGLRWKEISDSEELNSSQEEVIALIAEAFAAADKQGQIQPGIVKWLLNTRQDQHWQTTKATAASINLLQKEKGTAFGATRNISANIAGKPLVVSDDLLSGKSSAFSKVKKEDADIVLNSQGTGVSGALTWFYFTKGDRLDTLNKGIKIDKRFFVFDKNKNELEINGATILKPGDVVHVRLTIQIATHLTYVHIRDPRAAAFEPKDHSSGYQYSGHLSYYQSIKDRGLDLFLEAIPRGVSVINYELIVAQQGKFLSGPVKLQCMYKPALNAYSQLSTIIVEN